MKRLIIGDIQGCYGELLELVEKAALVEGDEIVSVGDFVDRGPDSPAALEFFRTHANARAIMGNHERKHVRSFQGRTHAALSQRITRAQFGEELYPNACAFMDSLPRFLDLPEAIIVHAFYEPGVPLAMQKGNVIVGVMSGDAYLRGMYARPWFELYDGDKPIVVGHQNYTGTDKPFVHRDRVFGIDTSCCHGLALTGLVLPDFRFVSVRAHANHWTETKRRFAHLKLQQASLEALSWSRIDTLLSAERSPRIPETVLARVQELARLRDTSTRLVERLRTHVLEVHDETERELRAESRFDELTAREQGQRYAARVGATPLAPLLYLTRKGKLSVEALLKRFPSPGELFRFARQIGIA